MKLKKETIIKLIAATIVPGGFIIWGIHELGRRYRSNSKKTPHDPVQTGSGKPDDG